MKKSLFLLIVMLVAIMLCVTEAQKQWQDKIDSLYKILKTAKEDTSKVNTLNAFANEFTRNKPDTAVYFATKALTFAIKLNYKIGIADAKYNIGLGLSFLEKYEESLNNFNDALKLYDDMVSSESTPHRLEILKRIGNTYNNIGRVNNHKGDYPEALKNFSSSLRFYEEIGDKGGMAKDYNGIGIVYDNQGIYPEALKNYFAAVKIREEIGDKRNLTDLYNNIGIVYAHEGNKSEALKNYLVALKIDEESGNKRGKNMTLMNIGLIYNNKGDYANGLKNLFEALKLSEELGDKIGMAMNLYNIGDVYYNQGNYTEGLKKFFASLKIDEEIGAKDNLAHDFFNIGRTYIYLKQNNEASRYLNKGLSLAKEIGSLHDIKINYLGLATLDSAQGKYKRSMENYKLYITYRDSLVNKENNKKTLQLQMQYEFDKKESLAKAEQDKKDALAVKELQKQKLIRNGFVGGSAVLLIFAVILFILKYQYERIRLIKKERNRISGELHDDIGAELTRITVISQLLYKKPEKDADMQEKLLNISDAGNKVLGSISEIIWTMNPQKDNLESLVAHIRRFAEEYLEMNGIEVNIEFPDEIPARSVSDEYRRNIFLVIKEAVNNITKYSKATRVQLSMTLEKRMAGIEIHDNGTGFSLQEKQNWGNGLKNMDQRMKDVGGTFRISSGNNEGTLIRLNFPVH